MKILFDFLPILLFFGAFKYAEGQKDWAAAYATEHLGFLVSGGVVGSGEAPVLLATVVVIVATFAQVAFLLARGKKIDLMLWVSFALVSVMGGATIWFHSETFIKWKPTALYWFMAGSLLVSQTVFRKNLLHMLLGDKVDLPGAVWLRLGLAWIGFFAAMGVLNLYVAFNFETATWVNFKLFGGTGLMFAFFLAQGLYLSRHLRSDETNALEAPRQP